jgi:AcrR family transcriptional regulator
MPARQDPVKKQLVEARRQQILDAAAAVFADKGFDRATTREVASAAGVSEGTIYNYFASKDDLLIGILSRLGNMMQPEMMEQEWPSDPHEFLAALFLLRLRLVAQYGAMLQAIFSKILVDQDMGRRYYEQIVKPALTPVEDHVRAYVEEGRFRQIDVDLFVHLLMAINVGMLTGSLMGIPLLEADPQVLTKALADLLYDGVRPQSSSQKERR